MDGVDSYLFEYFIFEIFEFVDKVLAETGESQLFNNHSRIFIQNLWKLILKNSLGAAENSLSF